MQTDSVQCLVAEALIYYRFRGASLAAIDAYAKCRTHSKQFKLERDQALSQLQSDGSAESK
jgi:hypothetical protein